MKAKAAHQKGLVELEEAGELLEELMNTVQPLQEHGTLFTHILSVLLMTTAIRKLMTVIQPLRLHQHLKTLPRPTDRQRHETLTSSDRQTHGIHSPFLKTDLHSKAAGI